MDGLCAISPGGRDVILGDLDIRTDLDLRADGATVFESTRVPWRQTPVDSYLGLLQPDSAQGYLNPAGKILRSLVRKHGVLIRPLGDVVYLLPPLCINDAQLDQCYDGIEIGLDALRDQA